MTVAHIEFIVEEPSMEAALRVLVPKMLHVESRSSPTFAIYPHSCKNELLQRLPGRLAGYARYLPSDWRIVVIVDTDDDDCKRLKANLEQIAHTAGLATRANGRAVQVINRLAVEELEAWYFGDWDAVCAAYPGTNPNVPKQAKYRDSDAIGGGTWEAFERILQMARHFPTGLRKIEAARTVATHMDPAQNRSPSFNALLTSLQELAQG